MNSGLLTDLSVNHVIIYIGMVITLLVPVITKLNAPAQIKALANIVLSALGAVLYTLVSSNGNGYAWGNFGLAFGSVFVVSTLTYYGATQPLGIALAVHNVTPTIGFGSPAPVVVTAPAPALASVDPLFAVTPAGTLPVPTGLPQDTPVSVDPAVFAPTPPPAV